MAKQIVVAVLVFLACRPATAVDGPLAFRVSWPEAVHYAGLPVACELTVTNVSDEMVSFVRPVTDNDAVRLDPGPNGPAELWLLSRMLIRDPPDVAELAPGAQLTALIDLSNNRALWGPGHYDVKLTYRPGPPVDEWRVSPSVLAAGPQTIEASFDVVEPAGEAEQTARAIYTRDRGPLPFLFSTPRDVTQAEVADPAKFIQSLLVPETPALASLSSRLEPQEHRDMRGFDMRFQIQNATAAVNRLIELDELLVPDDLLPDGVISPTVRELLSRPRGEVTTPILNRLILEDIMGGLVASSLYRLVYEHPDSVYFPGTCMMLAGASLNRDRDFGAAMAWLERARERPMDQLLLERWRWEMIYALMWAGRTREELAWLQQVRTQTQYAQWRILRLQAEIGEERREPRGGRKQVFRPR